MAAPERAGAFSPSAAATVPGGPVLIGLAAAVMAGGRAALAYMADIAAVVLFAAALLALLRTFLGPLPAGAAFLVTGALGLCLRRLMAAYTPSLLMEMGAEGLFFVVFLFLFCLCQTPAGYENLGTRSTAMVTKRDPTEMAPPSRNWASVWRLRRRLDQQTTEKVSSPQGKTPPPRK